MQTLIRRILLIVILLAIGYGIYWMIDKKGASDLKNDIVINTQETIKSIKNQNTGIVVVPQEIPNTTYETGDESLGDLSEIIQEKTVTINDPKINSPETGTVTIPQVSQTKTTNTSTRKKVSSSNILFQLFK